MLADDDTHSHLIPPASNVGHTLHVIGIAGQEIAAVRAVVNHHFHLPTFDGWTVKFDVAQHRDE